MSKGELKVSVSIRAFCFFAICYFLGQVFFGK